MIFLISSKSRSRSLSTASSYWSVAGITSKNNGKPSSKKEKQTPISVGSLTQGLISLFFRYLR